MAYVTKPALLPADFGYTSGKSAPSLPTTATNAKKKKPSVKKPKKAGHKKATKGKKVTKGKKSKKSKKPSNKRKLPWKV
jgi:hypothetical protein